MHRLASGAFLCFGVLLFILVSWILIPPGGRPAFAVPQQRTLILPEKSGDFRFYYLCKPQGVLNVNPWMVIVPAVILITGALVLFEMAGL